MTTRFDYGEWWRTKEEDTSPEEAWIAGATAERVRILREIRSMWSPGIYPAIDELVRRIELFAYRPK